MTDASPVTLVFLVHNRREELRTSLGKMLVESDYPGELEAIVVDNASTDGSAAMVRAEFPGVRLIARDENVGVSGWNDGFAAARGDWVLALDDDCYLPADGLRRAVAAAGEHRADLVSFSVVSAADPSSVLSDEYRTGLLAFWGCAVLFRRRVIQELGGYDPEIFIWANEVELMLRFFDRGHRHLYLPEVAARHMKSPAAGAGVDWPAYALNARNHAYVAAKLLRPRDAAAALAALLGRRIGTALVRDPRGWRAVAAVLRGYGHGLRRRRPVRDARLSRCYRRHFESYAGPASRTPRPSAGRGRRGGGRILPPEPFWARRPDLYPDGSGVLDFR